MTSGVLGKVIDRLAKEQHERGCRLVDMLSREAYLETHNQNPKPFRWYKKAEDILASVARTARALGK